ncbi:hypothetical protein AAFF_G00122770 [Aldrovandia affinis]|uniref:Uncharacterized protein n=1 Tax=Aldrovandia affinis TaxID=143900 RepID=A0AAD7R352_9TELE|nr:hypothetical protein AAFF_G00122770 [Aldrovandia affinis]
MLFQSCQLAFSFPLVKCAVCPSKVKWTAGLCPARRATVSLRWCRKESAALAASPTPVRPTASVMTSPRPVQTSMASATSAGPPGSNTAQTAPSASARTDTFVAQWTPCVCRCWERLLSRCIVHSPSTKLFIPNANMYYHTKRITDCPQTPPPIFLSHPHSYGWPFEENPSQM